MFFRALFALFSLGAVVAICPADYGNTFNGQCFRFYNDTKRTYQEAQAKCATDGAHLASIHSQDESDVIFTGMGESRESWIGLQCTSDFKPYWADGTPFDYQHFYNTDCAADMAALFLYYSQGEWYWNPQTLAWFTLCAIHQEPPTGPCEFDYSYIEEMDACVRVGAAAMSWNEAEASCQSANAHLVSIHSEQANSYIRRFSLSNGLDESIFIGLHLVDGTDGISSPVWTDNTTLDYRNFNQGMPTSDLGNCMAMETRTIAGDWISVTCDEQTKLPFLCTKTPPCPTTNTFFYDGEIFSPDYPSSPSRAVSCEYFVVGHPNTTVVVKFDEITLVNDDQILLYDGSESTAPMVTARAASVGNAYVTRLNNVMRIVYQTGTTTGTRAWHARFTTL